ncbi:hypothetical protein [Halarcobacter sp.]|uniref:hypothetical protein n=1 Tax=Halarcobacter sp. TaxID=2321133 RepID=UPI0029F59B14|nr:hypothetical protein [Halarcobacter sp.]
MKNLLAIIFISLLLIGCSGKNEFKFPIIKLNKEKVVKPVLEDREQVVEEIVEPIVEENEILESDVRKIAILYPSSKVGRYANSTINTISAFLIYNNEKFKLEAFDTYNENPMNISAQLELIKQKEFTKVITMFTKDGFDELNKLTDIEDIKFYFPLINKAEVITYNQNFIFGGISYEEQLNLLRSLSSGKNTMFYVKSYLGSKLKNIYEKTFFETGIVKEIERTNNRYKYIMNDERIKESTIILNTPIVKSSIILSQLTAFEVEPEKVLSTQLNYNPLLIKLTQPKDRENFYVVSSISKIDSFIEDYTKLLGSDVAYEWVDYSALVGANYFINENESELIKTKVIENQADYEQTLYKSTIYGFENILAN